MRKRSLQHFAHDTTAMLTVVACEKVCCDLTDRTGITAKRNFRGICFVMEKIVCGNQLSLLSWWSPMAWRRYGTRVSGTVMATLKIISFATKFNAAVAFALTSQSHSIQGIPYRTSILYYCSYRTEWKTAPSNSKHLKFGTNEPF